MSASIHALTHGWPSWMLGYSSVAVPMLAGLVQGRAPLGKFVVAPILALPLVLLAGTINTFLLRGLGVARDSVLELIVAVTVSAVIGYATGRFSARRTSSHSSYL